MLFKKIIFYAFLVLLGLVIFSDENYQTVGSGVAILLFGMIMLEEGFQVFAKGPLQSILKKATDKLYKSISLGAVVTALLQSSSLVSVITISFISAGIITLSSGIGLIFGANIGTTATAWLVAAFGLKFKISALAMPMLVFGVVFSLQGKVKLRGIGNILAGLGFFFLGIFYMKEGFEVFKSYIDFKEYAISGFFGVVVYAFLGVVITTILQSSSATMALILTALAAGQIAYENALALAVGANIGTTITAVLGALGANVPGKRLAGAHFIFNVVTGMVALALIYPLAQLVDYLMILMGGRHEDYTIKLAIFHTLFNILGVLLMLPFIKKMETFLVRVIKEGSGKGIDEPKYLNKSILEFPSTAASALLRESKYLYENAIFEIVAHALNLHRGDITSTDIKAKEVIAHTKEDFGIDVRDLYYQKVKLIYGEIIRYATTAQSTMMLDKRLNNGITDVIIANRKMIQVVKQVLELGRNVSKYQDGPNAYMATEYDKFRKKALKVLRTIYLFRTEEEEGYREEHHNKLKVLRKEAKDSKYQTTKAINKLINENLINAEMASSLVNDNNNLNASIADLIQVAELLYVGKDSLLEPTKDREGP